MKNIFLLVVFSFLTQLNLIAQDIYKPGSIITTVNDTVRGFIQDQMDHEMAVSFNFKEVSEDNHISLLTPYNILEISFDSGREFKRFEIKSPSNNSKYVLAKNLLKGKLELWTWRKPKGSSDYFIIDKSTNEVIHLINPKKDQITNLAGRDYKVQDLKYLGQLSLLMQDSKKQNSDPKKIKYSDKRLKRVLYEYNLGFANDYSISDNISTKYYSYDITVGRSLLSSKNKFIRAGIYRNKVYPEKSRTTSYIRGISFMSWHNPNKDLDLETFENGTSNYSWNLISIIPAGVKFEGKAKKFKPYIYGGIGVGLMILSDYKIVDHKNTGTETNFIPIPTINFGAGAKLKIGSKFLIAEITPSINGVFFNLGLNL
jgi:hypothetical protein